MTRMASVPSPTAIAVRRSVVEWLRDRRVISPALAERTIKRLGLPLWARIALAEGEHHARPLTAMTWPA